MTGVAGPRRRTLLVAALVATGVLAGCTAVVDGSPVAAPRRTSGAPASPATSGSSTPDFPSSPAAPTGIPARFRRSPVPTAVGDPMSVDVCAVLPESAVRPAGYSVFPDSIEYLPGCDLDLRYHGTTTASKRLDLAVALTTSSPTSGTHSVTTVSGQKVWKYPFAKVSGTCERDVFGRGVLARVSTYNYTGSAGTLAAPACAAADGATKAMAAAFRSGKIPALALASPSVTDVDSCAVAKASGAFGAGALAGVTYHDYVFGTGCDLRNGTVTIAFGTRLGVDSPPEDGKPVQAGSRTLYGDVSDSSYCFFVSEQGRTTKGLHEQIIMSVYARSGGKALCARGPSILGKYLDTAGLP